MIVSGIHITKSRAIFIAVILFALLIMPASADDKGVTRVVSSSIQPATEFDVILDITDIEIGGIVEQLPKGFTYVSSTHPDERMDCSGQNLTFSVIGDTMITYRVQGPSTGSGTFEGVWHDAVENVNGTITDSTVFINSGSSGDDSGTDSAISATKTEEVFTDADGFLTETCTLSASDGKASLILDEGVQALDASGDPLEEVQIKTAGSENFPSADEDGTYRFSGRLYECSPSGATFDPAIDLVFTLTDEEALLAENGKTYLIQWFNSETGSWEALKSVIDLEKKTVTATISHFSFYGLFEDVTVQTSAEAVVQETTTVAVEQDTVSSAPTVAAIGAEDQDSQSQDSPDATSSGNPMLIFGGILAVMVLAGGAYTNAAGNNGEDEQ